MTRAEITLVTVENREAWLVGETLWAHQTFPRAYWQMPKNKVSQNSIPMLINSGMFLYPTECVCMYVLPKFHTS